MPDLDPMLDEDAKEYADDRRVFLIDDGERHWYVAENAGAALKAHISLMDAEDADEFTVRALGPAIEITVNLDGTADFDAFPATFRRDEATDMRSCRIRAFAYEWAAHLTSGGQIASSCFS